MYYCLRRQSRKRMQHIKKMRFKDANSHMCHPHNEYLEMSTYTAYFALAEQNFSVIMVALYFFTRYRICTLSIDELTHTRDR